MLVSGAAFGSISHIAAFTVLAIVARELLDDAFLAGAAATTLVIGAAMGTTVLSALMLRRGRRVGLSAGYGIAVVGALIAAFSVVQVSFGLLLLGTLLLGFGNSSNQLARYAASDMAAPARRASAIGLVVWAATVGAILGPNLVPLAATASENLGLPRLVGPFLIPVIFAGLAGALLFILLRPDPYELAEESAQLGGDEEGGRPLSEILRRPVVAVAVTAMIVGQVVMVVIMTMTPLHMIDQGMDLAAVGLVISAHTAGMFALSPISGRITERLGSASALLIAAAVLALSGVIAAAAPASDGLFLVLALFLLGYGWNLGFVAGSSLLLSGVEHAERTRTQGFTDTMIWGSSAVASLSSGLILAIGGYAVLGLIGAAMVVIPVVAVLRMRRHLTIPAAAGP
ncbi:MAG: MFS transporter [Chloroflexota bacterium]